MSKGRRRFLRATGAALATMTVGPVWASTRSTARKLALYNLHTDERLKVTYRVGERYIPEALDLVSHHLRDHRNDEVQPIDADLLDLLSALSRRVEAREPFHVISGYRSPETNAMLRARGRGVAKQSLHMQGRAIDVRLPGRPLEDLRKAAIALRGGGVGYYPGSGFIHVDTGRVRHW